LYVIILKSYTNPTTTRHFAETHRDICISAQRAMHLCHETWTSSDLSIPPSV